MAGITIGRLRKSLAFAVGIGLLAGAALVGGHLARSSSGPLRGTPQNSFGFSKVVQAKIDRLNSQLDRCLLAHGAKRVPLGGGGWRYTDPGGRPSAACTAVEHRVRAFAKSPQMRAAVAAITPAGGAFARCLEVHGVLRATHGTQTAAQRATLKRAYAACGGSLSRATPHG